jgi:hypothetical protein
VIYGESVPPLAGSTCGNAVAVKRGRNAIKGHARGSEFLHVGNDGLFAIRRAVGLAAFAAAWFAGA